MGGEESTKRVKVLEFKGTIKTEQFKFFLELQNNKTERERGP